MNGATFQPKGQRRRLGQVKLVSWESLAYLYLVTTFALPQYFGVPLPGFALTAHRLVTIAFIFTVFISRKHGRAFLWNFLGLPATIYLLPLLIVYAYTAIAVSSINSVAGFLVDMFLTFYIVYYCITEILGAKRSIKFVAKLVAVVCVLAIYDMLRRQNPYELLHTIKNIKAEGGWRANSYRVAGLCGHPIAFGMYLMLLLPVICIDVEKKRFNLLHRPITLLLMALAMLGTGSRGPVACFAGECLVFFAISDRDYKRRYSGTIFLVFTAAVVLLVVFNEERHIDRWFWLNVFQIVDQIFDTHFTLDRYGYWQHALAINSTDYRSELTQLFFSPDLDPILGRGNQGDTISFVSGGFYIESIDNFYVLQYIRYAWPGVTATLFCFVGLVFRCLSLWRKSGRNSIYLAIGVAFVAYYINLWTVAELGTMKFYLAVFAIACALATCWGRATGDSSMEMAPPR